MVYKKKNIMSKVIRQKANCNRAIATPTKSHAPELISRKHLPINEKGPHPIQIIKKKSNNPIEK